MFQQSLIFTYREVVIDIVALCLERYDLLIAVANMPEFSSRCSWFEPWYFKPEDSHKTAHQILILSIFMSFQNHGMTWFSVMNPFLHLFLPSQSGGIQHWLSFVSGVHNNPSGFGPSVNLHKVDLVTHAHLGHLYYSVTICESNLLWYMKWYVVHTILTS